jgi:hypothetical protein
MWVEWLQWQMVKMGRGIFGAFPLHSSNRYFVSSIFRSGTLYHVAFMGRIQRSACCLLEIGGAVEPRPLRMHSNICK